MYAILQLLGRKMAAPWKKGGIRIIKNVTMRHGKHITHYSEMVNTKQTKREKTLENPQKSEYMEVSNLKHLFHDLYNHEG